MDALPFAVGLESLRGLEPFEMRPASYERFGIGWSYWHRRRVSGTSYWLRGRVVSFDWRDKGPNLGGEQAERNAHWAELWARGFSPTEIGMLAGDRCGVTVRYQVESVFSARRYGCSYVDVP